ncbi:MAG TPA: fibronectin type III domain-containing protein, partial [Bacteroidetes bacterium]|nr:fibronectin type III domain-containing protein [Bacteroidota bacterium]
MAVERAFRDPGLLPLLLILLLLALPGPGRAQVTEQGSLRGFILGPEPNTAYDNWISHTVEGLAVIGGYNDYIPNPLDPQTNGFGNFLYIPESQTDSARALWHDIFTAFFAGDLEGAQGLIDTAGINYDVVELTDSAAGRTFWLLRERLDSLFIDPGWYGGPDDDVIGSFDRGWGLFVYNPEATHPEVVVQCPHPNDDFISVPLAVELFLEADLGALEIHGTGREVYWSGGSYRNSRSLCDPSRNPNLPFQFFAESFVSNARAEGLSDLSIQIHSYDSAEHHGHASVQISCGQEDGYPNRPSRDLSSAGLDWVNFTPTFPVPAGYAVLGQAAVRISDYYQVWHAPGFVHLASGTVISTDVDLPGYSGSNQMMTASEGRNPLVSFDSYLHAEFDELPDAIAAAGYNEYELYSNGPLPPTQTNWEAMLRYYEASIDALTAYFDDIADNPDTTAPTVPELQADYASDRFVDLSWTASDDPNFAGYEIRMTPAVIPAPPPVYWSIEDDTTLVGARTLSTRSYGLHPGQVHMVSIRAFDFAGNVSPFSPPVTVVALDTTLPELQHLGIVSRYPLHAWPPYLRFLVRSREPLREVLVRLHPPTGPEETASFLPLDPWEPDEWIPFGGHFPATAQENWEGQVARYWLEVEEESLEPHLVTIPSFDGYPLTL